MPIKELEVFPQIILSEGQGFVGTRRWSLDLKDNVNAFMNVVCRSHWPSRPDVIPVSVQSGAFWDGAIVTCHGIAKAGTMGSLPTYNKYLVVVQYALHRMTNCWPRQIPKPWHPKGTTLSLKIRGSGQYLLISPAGLRGASIASYGGCADEGGTGTIAIPQQSLTQSARIIIPITEYHVTCDRMTRSQVENALILDWDNLNGCVNAPTNNSDGGYFLGAPPGTLLMDGYEIDESFACDYIEPLRYRMSAVFKQRIITDTDGVPKVVGTPDCHEPVGWNFDYIGTGRGGEKDDKGWGWRKILMLDEYSDNMVPRYHETVNFRSMFGGTTMYGHQTCDGQGSDGSAMPNLCTASDPALPPPHGSTGSSFSPSEGTPGSQDESYGGEPDPGDPDYVPGGG